MTEARPAKPDRPVAKRVRLTRTDRLNDLRVLEHDVYLFRSTYRCRSCLRSAGKSGLVNWISEGLCTGTFSNAPLPTRVYANLDRARYSDSHRPRATDLADQPLVCFEPAPSRPVASETTPDLVSAWRACGSEPPASRASSPEPFPCHHVWLCDRGTDSEPDEGAEHVDPSPSPAPPSPGPEVVGVEGLVGPRVVRLPPTVDPPRIRLRVKTKFVKTRCRQKTFAPQNVVVQEFGGYVGSGRRPIHHTHRIAGGGGVVWCWHCGRTATTKPRALCLPCGPPHLVG